MKTPLFWNTRSGFSTMLLPLAALYDMAGVMRRQIVRSVTMPVPVICIGNLTAGGAGKTPVAIAIGERLKNRNVSAFFLSRGYGGSLGGPILVDVNKHSASEVGDEPLLLAKILPTIVSKDRVNGARLAVAQGAQLIIMDDGFQNPSLAKTLSIAVIDGGFGFGNGRIIPAGPLRESPQLGLKRAHAAVIVNPSSLTPELPPGKPLLNAKLKPREDAQALKGKKVVAFCGIARPQKFLDTLRELGASIEESVTFPDHHAYSTADLKKLSARANAQQALLVTTVKDAVRLPPSIRKLVNVVEIDAVFDDMKLLDSMLDFALGQHDQA